MILDSLLNTERYENLHPRFKEAFEFLLTTDFAQLPDGRIDIDGDSIYASIATVDGKVPEGALLERHEKYIDIQIPLNTAEGYGWKAGELLDNATVPYNDEKDIIFYKDKPTSIITALPGDFVVFFPEDAHAPCIGYGHIRKVVIKIMI